MLHFFMLNKIIKNLFSPHKIPLKIFNKINFYIKNYAYKSNFFEQDQNSIFQKIFLDRQLGIKKLNSVKEQFNFLKNKPMSSEHEVLFSSISIDNKIKEILEIGTYDGANAFLLSKLFPNSKIDTIDIDSKDKDFINFYNREESVKEFIDLRNKNLSKNSSINFIELNSCGLINHKKKYDLIWIDGAHGYPVVCMDIVNSLHLINDNGFIALDDVCPHLEYSNSDKMYSSVASYETLKELEKQNLIKLNLIYKRLESKYNCLPKKRKFVSIFKKLYS